MTQFSYVLELTKIGDGAAQQHRIREGRVVLGRSSTGATLVVSDPKVSNRHAEILFADGLVRVKDLGSSNGTWKSGARQAARFQLPEGGSFTAGNTRVALVAVEGGRRGTLKPTGARRRHKNKFPVLTRLPAVKHSAVKHSAVKVRTDAKAGAQKTAKTAKSANTGPRWKARGWGLTLGGLAGVVAYFLPLAFGSVNDWTPAFASSAGWAVALPYIASALLFIMGAAALFVRFSRALAGGALFVASAAVAAALIVSPFARVVFLTGSVGSIVLASGLAVAALVALVSLVFPEHRAS